MVFQEKFIRLKCFLQYFSLPKAQLIDIWVKILDPQSLILLPRPKMFDFLESLARGSTNQRSTIISKQYA